MATGLRPRLWLAGCTDVSRTVFITGVAGFIGSHMARALLAQGWTVVGIDNEQSTPEMVPLRLASLCGLLRFHYTRANLCNRDVLADLFAAHPDIDVVLHLAARAGVRQSRLNPYAYIEDNIKGQVSLLEACRSLPQLRHILYASSSAVYGPSATLPFSEEAAIGAQASFYATTKRMNELTAQTYSHLYGFAQTGMRFFTVYGPEGRPDMACYGFAKAIHDGTPLTLWDAEGLARDFTYIDDVVAAILHLMETPPAVGESRLFNIGYGEPRSVGDLIRCLETVLKKKAIVQKAPKPAEDMLRTWADTTALKKTIPWAPQIPLEEGIRRFGQWFSATF